MKGRCRRGRERGVTLVELLVAIFIAGIAFALLVPLFVQAQKFNSSDKARIEALNIAQAKIELIRGLDFAQIDSTTPHPQSPTADPSSPYFIAKYLGNPYPDDPNRDPDDSFHSGDFAPTYTEPAEAGPKVFWIHYKVTAVTATYKKVIVEVGWDGNPKPLRTAVLQTLIYAQWGGPRIEFFDVATHENGLIVTNGQVELKAIVESADVSRTTAVTFSMRPRGGTATDVPGVQDLASDPTGRTWSAVWTTDLADAVYTFTAVAYADKDAGNAWQRTYRVEEDPPSPPTQLVATTGKDRALLQWTPSPSLDVDHYEVYEGSAAYDPTLLTVEEQATRIDGGLVTSEPLCLVGDGTPSADAALETKTYRFYIRAVDEAGKTSDWAASPDPADPTPWGISVTPDGVNHIPPAPPTDLWFSVSGSDVTLSWTAPPGDIRLYTIYRWNGANPEHLAQYDTEATTQTIPLGWDVQAAYFQVRSVGPGVAEQQLWWATLRQTPTITPSTYLGGIAWATVTTPPAPVYDMSFYNNVKKDAVISVTWLANGIDTPKADETPVTLNMVLSSSKNSAAKAVSIGYHTTGWYHIYWQYTSGGQTFEDDKTYHLISSDPIPIPVP